MKNKILSGRYSAAAAANLSAGQRSGMIQDWRYKVQADSLGW